MFSFQRLAVGVLVALGILTVTSQRSEAVAASIYAETRIMGPAYYEPGGSHVGLILSVSIESGLYYGGIDFTGTADARGNLIDWEYANRNFAWELVESAWNPAGASTVGYFVGADIPANAPPGVYDRNPSDLSLPATVTIHTYDDEGNRFTNSTTVRFTIPGPVVPEPASALLLASGLVVPAGLAWLRRRRAG